MMTTVTDRGQTSIPARLRRAAGLVPGRHLRWHPVSEREFRVVATTAEDAPGPLAVLGWAKRFASKPLPRSDEAMAELRAGEEADALGDR